MTYLRRQIRSLWRMARREPALTMMLAACLVTANLVGVVAIPDWRRPPLKLDDRARLKATYPQRNFDASGPGHHLDMLVAAIGAHHVHDVRCCT